MSQISSSGRAEHQNQNEAHLRGIVVAHLQEALQARGAVLGPLALHAVREQHDLTEQRYDRMIEHWALKARVAAIKLHGKASGDSR
jgi:hypothetical protein